MSKNRKFTSQDINLSLRKKNPNMGRMQCKNWEKTQYGKNARIGGKT